MLGQGGSGLILATSSLMPGQVPPTNRRGSSQGGNNATQPTALSAVTHRKKSSVPLRQAEAWARAGLSLRAFLSGAFRIF